MRTVSKKSVSTLRGILLFSAFVGWVFAGGFAFGQKPSQTEAEDDGLLGPVESAITDVHNYGPDFTQPEGPAIVYPPGFKALEFDREGMRTQAGEILPNGKFFGEIMQNDRDKDGRITHRVYTDFASGKLSHEDWYGPNGPVRSDVYIDGVLFQRARLSYDASGRVVTRIIEDGKGTPVESRVIQMTSNGQVARESTVGKGGGAIFHEEIDNRSNSHSFERFAENGKPELKSSLKEGEPDQFWAASNKRNQWGSNSTSFASHSDADRTNCTNNGCTTAHIHYEYADEEKRHPLSAEWRDASGKLLYAAYYEYVWDDHKNWTRRDVWVLSPKQPEQTLYETDVRTIRYWER